MVLSLTARGVIACLPRTHCSCPQTSSPTYKRNRDNINNSGRMAAQLWKGCDHTVAAVAIARCCGCHWVPAPMPGYWGMTPCTIQFRHPTIGCHGLSQSAGCWRYARLSSSASLTLLSPSNASMWVATLSRNHLSWLITIVLPAKFAMASSRHLTHHNNIPYMFEPNSEHL